MAGCSPKKRAAPGAKVAHFVFEDDVKNGDPAQANDVISSEFIGHIFEGLLSFSYLGRINQVVPLLAEADPVVKDKGRSVTFRLRKDVFFQDDPAFKDGKGRQMTSEDFIYSLKRIADPHLNGPNFWTLDGIIEGLNDWRDNLMKAESADDRRVAFEKPVAGLIANKPHMLTLKLTRPYPQLNYVLAMPHMGVVAREVVEKYGAEILNHPVGTGPFQLQEWVRGSKIILVKNPSYRLESYPTVGSDEMRQAGLLKDGGKRVPFIDQIEFDIIKEEQPRWLKFLKGELDEVRIPKDSFSEAIEANGEIKKELADTKVKLQKELSLTNWWIEFNLKDPLFEKNLKLRQALCSAFDRERALKLLHNNRGVLADSPLPPGVEGGNEVPKWPFDYNVARAKKLLSEAGYPDGKGLEPISFDLRMPGTTPRQLGELMKDNLSKIGVSVNIIANSYPEALEKAKTSRFQMMLGGWQGDYPDPENFLQVFASSSLPPGPNSSNFSNKEFDRLYQAVRTQNPGRERRRNVAKMVEILQKEAPACFFYTGVEYRLSRSALRNYRYHLLYMGKGKFVDL